MSKTAAALTVIAKAVSVVNGLISMHDNAVKYRDIVSRAIANNRDLTDAELEILREDAQTAIDEALVD